MKNLFLSPERIILRSYQRELVFRGVGLIALITAFLQLPILFFAFTAWRDYQAQSDRKVQLLATENELQSKLMAFKETRQKLGQIQQWEPIIRGRLPCGAVLAAIEQTVPVDAVLEKISIEAARFQALPVVGGTYRVPEVYTLSLQGTLKFGHADELDAFTTGKRHEREKHDSVRGRADRRQWSRYPFARIPRTALQTTLSGRHRNGTDHFRAKKEIGA